MNEPVQPAKTAGRMDWFLLVLLAISLTGNVLLGYGVFRLATRVGPATAEARQEAPIPTVGTPMPALEVRDLKGEKVSLSYASDARPTVIYVFTPECTWCARNLNNLKAVLAASQQSYRIVGLSLDPNVASYLKESGLDFPVYTNPTREMVAAYGLGSTPSTVVVSPDGRLMKFWRGAYASSNKKEVENFFHITLPGLKTATE